MKVIGEITNAQVIKHWKGVKTQIILTDERVGHIREGHAEDYDAFSANIPDTIQNPAHVLCDARDKHTAMFIGHIDGTSINVIVKLAFKGTNSDLESSVITMYRLGEKTLRRLMKKHLVVYSREKA